MRYVILYALCFLCGCSSIDKHLYNQQVVQTKEAVTNTVLSYVTNTVPVMVEGKTVTNTVIQPISTTTITPALYTTNLVDNPIVTTSIEVTRDLPIPFAGLAGGLLAMLYSSYRMIRNKQTVNALVNGIEAGRQLLQTTPELKQIDDKFKDLLIHHQEIAGVLNEVSKVVNDKTGNTK
jgi:hypothetical protein